MSIDDSNLEPLQAAFRNIAEGPIHSSNTNIEHLLGTAWDSLQGSNATKMKGEKIGRIEDLERVGNTLVFKIERHGGTINGSSRAELHTWVVDVGAGIASIAKTTHRQLSPVAKRVDVGPLASEIFAIIVENRDDTRLKWSPDRKTCVVNIGLVIPATNQQTTLSRRKRFRTALAELLATRSMSISPRNQVHIGPVAE